MLGQACEGQGPALRATACMSQETAGKLRLPVGGPEGAPSSPGSRPVGVVPLPVGTEPGKVILPAWAHRGAGRSRLQASHEAPGVFAIYTVCVPENISRLAGGLGHRQAGP